jgi:hypothetical protein
MCENQTGWKVFTAGGPHSEGPGSCHATEDYNTKLLDRQQVTVNHVGYHAGKPFDQSAIMR